MADRKFFKDFTPGELQYLTSVGNRIGLTGFSSQFLQRREDGTYRFDEMSEAQRSAIFRVLENPQVKQVTLKYGQEWESVSKADRPAITSADVVQSAPEAVSEETRLRREEQIARFRKLAAETEFTSDAPAPAIDPFALTEADLRIGQGDGAVVQIPVPLTAAEAAQIGIDGYDTITQIATLSSRNVLTVEAETAMTRAGDYFRLVQLQTSAESVIAGQVVRSRLGADTNVVKVQIDPETEAVTIRNQKNDEYVLNRDEQEAFYKQRQTQFTVLEQQENELRYFRVWAEERGYSQKDIEYVFNTDYRDPATNELRPVTGLNPDFQIHLADYKAANGRLPFATPADDARVAEAARVQAIVDGFAQSNPQGGGAADKIESTGGADTELKLTDAERARLASSATLDELKRDAIINGSPPIATPVQVAASQVAAVEAAPASGSNNTEFYDALVDAFQKSAVKVTDSSGPAGENDVAAVQNNPLDAYESYTYGLSLHVLDKSEYDNLAQNSKNWTPQHTLIASAGRWHETAESRAGGSDYLKREPGWEDNFFFDSLKMTQLQAPSTTGRSTNTIDMEFVIIEPYGLTLLDRMIRTANKLKEESYMHLCYMLQIDFFDSEKGQLIEHRKYLPITLTGMNIKVSGKGTQYTVQAYPFHYKALMNTIATTPLDVDVVSSTLREFFADENTNDSTAGGAAAEEQIRREEERNKTIQTGGTVVASSGNYARQIAFQGSAATEKAYEIHSYVAVYNGWWQAMKKLNAVDPKIDPQNIKVRFSDEIIAKEKLTKPIDAVAGKGPMAKSDAKQGTAPPEQNKYNGFGFKAGTGIIEVINTAMMSSEYIRSQVRIANKDESQTGNKIGTVNWWKILPQVKLNGFDNTLNRWSYSVTYFVVPYKIWNTKHPNLPKNSPRRTNCVKQYNYLYTGDNRSIIDFQVEFDMLYFTTVAGFKQINTDRVDRKESGSPDGAEQVNPAIDTNDRKGNSNTITPVVHNLVPHDASNSSGNNLTQDPIAVALGTIQDSIYSGVNGEMLTVHMKIIGDPTLVKQDDLFINIGQYYDPSQRSQSSDGILLNRSHHNGDNSLNNNSIVTDAGEVLAWIQVLMPPDIDENTGGLRLGAGASSVNSFTGVYKIMEVQNEFSQGKFIQTLILIRYQEQDADKDYRQALAIERERIKSDVNNDAGVTTPGNLARSSDQKEDAVSPDDAKDSSQVGIAVASASEESSLSQTASNVQTDRQFNLLDTGILPESVIERTDLV